MRESRQVCHQCLARAVLGCAVWAGTRRVVAEARSDSCSQVRRSVRASARACYYGAMFVVPSNIFFGDCGAYDAEGQRGAPQ